MKQIVHNIIRFVCAAALTLLSMACTTDNEVIPQEDVPTVYPKLSLSVSEMTMIADSRSPVPMSPDAETYVKTVAIFEFDNEGLHNRDWNTYHFVDFLAGTVDGNTGVGDVEPSEYGVVESDLKGIALKAYSNGTVCMVANVTEQEVDILYNDYRESPEQSYGRLTFDKFTEWAMPFNYEEPGERVYDETKSGHLKTMYMFGYYQGSIDPAMPDKIYIDLGRLASRLDITIVNETGADITKRLGYHFDKVCHSAYFFPMKKGTPPSDGAGKSRTVICSGIGDPVDGDIHNAVPETFPAGGVHTRYFYVAAHSAASYDDATKLHLFYDRRIVNDNTTDDDHNSVSVPMCNVNPLHANGVENGYSLSRNTRYHFTIRLRSKNAAPTSESAQARSVDYGENTGDIIVYLPIDN